ncbi:ferritin [Synechococcus sp. BIOS-E4-1]|uniref:ferritin n=1 Tax=Synechococcus sp. BIOS-E4-1 TaxID=1400864 RepID=UPI001644FF7F|nr:ferritin [Synechococcus sp. BIOS-E4-1]QNI54133.1 ferritin [Synechococcus sp. BIOS-E4-1]
MLSDSSKHLEVQVGPSGRAMAESMDPALLEGFQAHFNMERQAHATYFGAAIWMGERELRGFSKHFNDEARGEQEHAAKVADYLIARAQSPELQALEAPDQSWKSVLDVMSTAFLTERDVTTSLQQLLVEAERVGDSRSTVFLEPMVEQQIKAEHEAAHLLGRTRFADGQAAAVLVIDNELREGVAHPAQLQ